MNRVLTLLDAIEQMGMHRDGTLLTNQREWHDLRMEMKKLDERMRMLSANPAMTLPGDTSKAN